VRPRTRVSTRCRMRIITGTAIHDSLQEEPSSGSPYAACAALRCLRCALAAPLPLLGELAASPLQFPSYAPVQFNLLSVNFTPKASEASGELEASGALEASSASAGDATVLLHRRSPASAATRGGSATVAAQWGDPTQIHTVQPTGYQLNSTWSPRTQDFEACFSRRQVLHSTPHTPLPQSH
jgi:hypothetical protein